jgi:hypothetical protein
VPGQIAFGQSSAFAGAPSMTGGIFSIVSSSLGNLKPASLNALPKSFSLGKSRWQVLQLVPYKRENAGIAWAGVDHKAMIAKESQTPGNLWNRLCLDCITEDLLRHGVQSVSVELVSTPA